MLEIILSIGAIIIGVLLCSFLIILDSVKDELWEEIYDKRFKRR